MNWICRFDIGIDIMTSSELPVKVAKSYMFPETI